MTSPSGRDKGGAPDRLAFEELCDIISDISEENWAAGWLSGIEYRVWDMIHREPARYPSMREWQRPRLLELAKRLGGWVLWKEDVGQQFVRMDEWIRLVAANRPKTE